MFAVSLHLSAYYGQYPHVCVLLTKNLELQRPLFWCPNPARVLRFCLHVVLTLFVVLPASPAVFYELRLCVSWLWPLFCLYVVRTGLHVHVCFFPVVSFEFQVSSYWFMCYRCIVRLASYSFVLVLALPLPDIRRVLMQWGASGKAEHICMPLMLCLLCWTYFDADNAENILFPLWIMACENRHLELSLLYAQIRANLYAIAVLHIMLAMFQWR